MLALPLALQHSTPTNSQSSFYNMSYLYFGALNTYVDQVEKTKGSLNMVSPNYFDISKEGELDITWRLQTSFILEMQKRGIKVVPFLANHWDKNAGINGLENRDKLARDIANAIDKYNLDGVNVDIEGIDHAYRDEHTDLIRLLRKYIPSDKEVSVAVAANPNGWKLGWHGFYDYNALAKYADHLIIMAYDESWESPESPIGPVSSLSFFERSVQYAINQGVPKDRIIAGLPFYGRMWKLDGPNLEGQNITGKGLSSTRVEPLVNQFNGSIHFDKNTQSSYATFNIPKGQNAFVGSTNLTEGDYVIWFENEPSISAKLSIPSKYGIKGTGSWALYHETPDTWDYYLSALNGTTNNKEQMKRIGSGTLGIIKGSDVRLRSNASLSAEIVQTLASNTITKVSGQSVSVDNHSWYPVELQDGTSGYVSGSYISKFELKELYGKNRYETSSLISNSGWEGEAQSVVIGRGDVPIDALTGSVLARKLNSPLLLTESSKLPENVKSEIDRLAPEIIYLLGGESAISDAVKKQLQDKGYEIERISGNSRYDTAVRIADEVGINNELILTTGIESPDALSIAPYAGLSQTPIILTRPTSIPDEVRNIIEQHNITQVTIIGGEGAVSGNVEAELEKMGVQVVRVKGSNRYETSVAIARHYSDELNFSDLYFASGASYIDALPGSPLAAKSGAPIILINNGTLPSAVKNFLQNDLTATPNVVILGGYGVISDSTRMNLFKMIK